MGRKKKLTLDRAGKVGLEITLLMSHRGIEPVQMVPVLLQSAAAHIVTLSAMTGKDPVAATRVASSLLVEAVEDIIGVAHAGKTD